ncbi:MAG: uncharacterized protein JWN55_612 [Frankiales bacterium]|jgi:hypothetical protein|nr:uncharacterized protein [Frankiales bacterium]
MAFYWCTEHATVEQESGCRAELRLGPYPTREAAEHALQSVQERNAKLDAEDRAWEEGEQ